MTEYLQKLHGLFCSFRSIGEQLTETDLIAQILINLPSPYSPFVTVTNNQISFPTFASLRPRLLNEEDHIAALYPEPSPNLLLSSSTNNDGQAYGSSNKGGYSNSNRGPSYSHNRGGRCWSFECTSPQESVSVPNLQTTQSYRYGLHPTLQPLIHFSNLEFVCSVQHS
ncbi:hypothetical protein LIER_14770 [Lithospermum erythrorhizon]|uniref:Uncharacterized protein n=1 Tax=Lithospermum erythrorhizon TaxID=34254 RepID=A0AAV3Q4Y8_LITER